MKKDQLITTVSASFNKMGFQLKKHSPEILVVAGVIGTIASAVMACKATTKVSEVLNNTKNIIDSIHNCQENEAMADQYTPEDAKKDLAIVYVQTGVKLAKLYAPAVALGALSLGSILASNNILRKRNVALAAAYATVDKTFKEYRNRVVERFGEQVDKELRHNIKAQKIDKMVTDEETGKEKKVKETIQVAGSPDKSDYAKFFDSSCKAWEENAEYNMMYLKAQQQYANDKLKAQGYLFLNDVYDMLGIPRTKAGQIVGWFYDPKNPNHKGDDYVDFGLYDLYKEKTRDFVNGYEEVILLDFNVDGPIINLI
jgi:hypothetical protein|nr:MAG TPA: hypothetical protein [Caudoviricetes sp.]